MVVVVVVVVVVDVRGCLENDGFSDMALKSDETFDIFSISNAVIDVDNMQGVSMKYFSCCRWSRSKEIVTSFVTIGIKVSSSPHNDRVSATAAVSIEDSDCLEASFIMADKDDGVADSFLSYASPAIRLPRCCCCSFCRISLSLRACCIRSPIDSWCNDPVP